ncbi:MAG: serine/threonine-protein kinase [Erythrobacter sp.]
MTDQEIDIQAMALLERALQQPKEQQRNWLNAVTDASREVIDRALEMIGGMDSASEHLSTGAPGEGVAEAAQPERIGAYRVVELLGQGGMGSVFKAERDAEDFEHLVAIKVIRPGLMSEQLVERFERERQILAGLSHLGIARLYDGGTTEDGGPYFVMEFIDGQPIDKWVQSAELNINQYLELTIRVSEAVAFAHQNLIVHRDLTPNNVLVTADGQPKLIDFGIAKPQDDDAPLGQAQGGSLSQLSLTPGYAAPERYDGVMATTLSDIYSLGKLLDRLLDGHPRDPDIDAIIATATATDPADRYATASAFAQDIERYLGGHVLAARPVSKREWVSKFYNRNRVPVTASIAGLAVLVSALVLAATAYFQAENARAAESTRVRQLRTLANYMLFDHNQQLSTVIGNAEARVQLVDRAQSYLLTLSELSEDDPTLNIDTARGFIELARIQGVSAQPNFGDQDLALENLDRARQLLERPGTPTGSASAAARGRLEAYRSLILLHAQSKPAEAEEAIEDGLTAVLAIPENERGIEWYEALSYLRRAQFETADLALDAPALSELVGLFRQEMDQWPTELKESPRKVIDQAIIQYYFATSFSYGDGVDPARSLAEYDVAEQLFSDFLELRPNDPFALYFKAWNAYYAFGVASQNDRLETASERLDRAQQTTAQLRLIEERDESLQSFAELLLEARADLDARLGKFDQAIAAQQTIVDQRTEYMALSNNSSSRTSDLAYGHVILADIGRRAGRRALACESYGEADKLMGIVADRGELRGYVGKLRAGVQENIALCGQGSAVSALKEINED